MTTEYLTYFFIRVNAIDKMLINLELKRHVKRKVTLLDKNIPVKTEN